MCKENVAGFNKPTPSKVKFPEEVKKEKVCSSRFQRNFNFQIFLDFFFEFSMSLVLPLI